MEKKQFLISRVVKTKCYIDLRINVNIKVSLTITKFTAKLNCYNYL